MTNFEFQFEKELEQLKNNSKDKLYFFYVQVDKDYENLNLDLKHVKSELEFNLLYEFYTNIKKGIFPLVKYKNRKYNY